MGGLLLFGTTTSLFAKIVYELQSQGLDGDMKYFRKPWAMTLLMFAGMSFCLPIAYFMDRKSKESGQLAQPLLGEPPRTHSEVRETLLLGIPTFFDLVATVLMNIGLLSVTASVYQMMRGAEMLFAALFAVLFLQRTLNKYHLAGILCCVIGITLVGTSSLLSGEGSATQVVSQEEMMMGMALIILSQAVQAAQLTFEDFFMADMNVPPMKIVGYEGVFGTLAMVLIMMPIVYFVPGPEGQGLHEDTLDTFHMISHNPRLIAILLIDLVALLLYNVAGMMVTGHLGAVFRTVLETMRTLFVWLVDLLLFYTPLGMGQLGESWSVYSWIQAAGFVVLVTGTLVYGRGDEEGVRAEMAQAEAVMAAQDPSMAGPMDSEQGSGPRDIATYAQPIAQPIDMSRSTCGGSFRANQTIVSTSLSRSHGAHGHGLGQSVPRDIPVRPAVPAPRQRDDSDAE